MKYFIFAAFLIGAAYAQESSTTERPECRQQNWSCSNASYVERDRCCEGFICRHPEQGELPPSAGDNTRCLPPREETTTTTQAPQNCRRIEESCSDFLEEDKCCSGLHCRRNQQNDPHYNPDDNNERCYETATCKNTGEACERDSECCDTRQQCRRDFLETRNTCKDPATTTTTTTTQRTTTTRRSTTERPTTTTTQRSTTTQAPRCYNEGEENCDKNELGCCDDLECQERRSFFGRRSHVCGRRSTTTERSTTTTTQRSTTTTTTAEPRCRRLGETCQKHDECCPELHCAQNIDIPGVYQCSRKVDQSSTTEGSSTSSSTILPILG